MSSGTSLLGFHPRTGAIGHLQAGQSFAHSAEVKVVQLWLLQTPQPPQSRRREMSSLMSGLIEDCSLGTTSGLMIHSRPTVAVKPAIVATSALAAG